MDTTITAEELVNITEKFLSKSTNIKELYTFQREAMQRVFEEFLEKGRVRGIIQMPTGSGKTILAAAIIAGIVKYYEIIGYSGKILVLFLAPKIVIKKTSIH